MWLASSAGVRDLGRVDVVDFEGFEHLGLGEMADPGLAITGMVTASWMLRIIARSGMRATPPSRRMSEGTARAP
jgi:hypothetical protein